MNVLFIQKTFTILNLPHFEAIFEQSETKCINWKHTGEKSQTNVTNMTSHHLGRATWGPIWKYTVDLRLIKCFNIPIITYLKGQVIQGWLKVPYNVGIPTFKYEKIELLVCIYEISRELVFIYGISGCSRCLTPVTIVNHIPFHPKFIWDSHSQAN